MVKPKHWCWQFFAKGKETTKAICKFCSASNRGHAGEMAHHLTNQCKKIGPEARKTIENLAGIKKKTEEPPASKVSKRGGSSFSSYQASSQSIASYFDQITEEEQAEFDILLTRAFATGNIAANFLDNPFFKELLNKMRPSYKIPSRKYTYPKILLPAEFKRVKSNLMEATSKSDFLALSSDGWSDINRNRLINVIVHAPQPFLLDTIDTTLDAHTGDFIRGVLSEQIEKLGKHKIIALVTDHAANMRLAWELLSVDYPWILFEGCKAHMVDLAAKDLSKCTSIVDCIKDCEKIAKFFRKKIPSLVLKETQATTSGRTRMFQLPEPTRWSTYATLISDVSDNEDCLKSAVWNANITGIPSLSAQAKDLQQLVCNNEAFWTRVSSINALLSPLAKAIKSIEGSMVNQRQAYKSIWKAFDKAEEAIGNFEGYLQPQLLRILSNRREFGRTDITYLMDMLEPSDRGRNLTQEEVQAAMNLLSNKVSKNPAFIARENEIMIELAQWRSRTGIFAEGQRKFAWDALRATPPVDGLTFWTGFYSDSVLSIVYKALQLVQITAAPTERNWSLRAAIHTKVRNRLHVEMVSKLTFIKHNLLLEHKDLFKKPSSQEKLEEEFEENANQESELFDDLVFEELVFDE